MTVADLIKALQELNPEMPIVTGYGDDTFAYVTDIATVVLVKTASDEYTPLARRATSGGEPFGAVLIPAAVDDWSGPR